MLFLVLSFQYVVPRELEGDAGKAPVKTGMEQEVSLRVIEGEDKSSAE